MKPRVLLTFSLGLNVALIGTLLAFRCRPAVPYHAPAPATSPALEPAGTPEIATPPPPAEPTASTNSTFDWRTIESADYRRYVANLRAIGCPERTIRDIIVADIDDLYASKARAVPSPPEPPWRNADRRRADQRSRAAAVAALRAEKRALVRELIGYEWDNHANETWHQDFITGLLFGFLPDDKAPQLLSIANRYTDEADGIKAAANDILIDEDRVRLRKLYDALVGEASQLLNPADREEVELRVQAAWFMDANDIHWDGVGINGAQLREFVRLSKKFQDIFRNEFLGLSSDSDEAQARHNPEFQKQVENLLGPALYAEYLRAQDSQFREDRGFLQEHGLPAAAAAQLHSIRRGAEDQATRVKADPLISAPEKAAALKALKARTAGSISSALGRRQGEYLEGPGRWLESLESLPDGAAPDTGP